EYQYITFKPTQIDGLPPSPTVGETTNLAVTGDLQIRDIVAPATFAVTVTAASDVQLEGLAVATVHRADFDLQIPDVDGVAEVSDDVRLEFEFVALAEDTTD
ncbi:MAG: YceI family protein, partial [Anaerolineae bacterium]